MSEVTEVVAEQGQWPGEPWPSVICTTLAGQWGCPGQWVPTPWRSSAKSAPLYRALPRSYLREKQAESVMAPVLSELMLGDQEQHLSNYVCEM